MRERPILFSAAMVRALLAGTKTQTRRVIRPQPSNYLPEWPPHYDTPTGGAMWGSIHGDHGTHCPYGKPGDRLWVRETFAVTSIARAGDGFDVCVARAERMPPGKTLADTDGGLEVIRVSPDEGTVKVDCERWRPSIFMPRWACRLVLEVTAVRVERLQDISEPDAKAEGVQPNCDGLAAHPECPACKVVGQCQADGEYIDYGEGEDGFPAENARESYRSLWDSLNAQRGLGWATNPWIWVVEFKQATPSTKATKP